MRLTIKQRNDELNKTYIDGVSVDYLTADLNASRVMNKLGQLEDIEDELGIDLSLLNSICQKGLYFKKEALNTLCLEEKHIYYAKNYDIHIEFFGRYQENKMGVSIMVCVGTTYHSLNAKDYGKTWALTKEELL